MVPKLSVVMPVWNGERFLRAAIESVLGQSFTDFELIVVDDGSTDRTPQILDSYSDPRLQRHRLDHAGIVVALNHGVAAARAEWIARQDADDIALPERFAAQWKALQRHPGAVLSFADVVLIGEAKSGIRQPHLPRTKALLALRSCFECPIVHSTVIFKKAAFQAAGGYRPEERHAEDFALWGRFVELGELVSIRKPLLQLRLHSQSVSKANAEAQLRLTEGVALDHCRRFLRLDENDARRAFQVLRQLPTQRPRAEWWWFLHRCAPRLRWQSWESAAWLGAQTLRLLAGGR